MKDFRKNEDFVCKTCGEKEEANLGTVDEDAHDDSNLPSSADEVSIHTDHGTNRTFTIDEEYACNYCRFKATDQKSLEMHMDSVHNNPCPICERDFEFGVDVRKHVAEEHVNPDEPLPDERQPEPIEFILNYTIDGVPVDGQVYETLDNEEEDFARLRQNPQKQSSMKVSVDFVRKPVENIVNLSKRKRNMGNK